MLDYLATGYCHCLQIDDLKRCHIATVIMLRRSDKRPDRVEISPEQLCAATAEAEVTTCHLIG